MQDFIAVCAVLAAAELVARFCSPNVMVDFVRGLAVLVLLVSGISGLFSVDWDLARPEIQAEQSQEELSGYVSDQLEEAAREDVSQWVRGLLASAQIEAEKIVPEIDITEDGSIVLKKVSALFAYQSETERAGALLRNILGEETEVEVQTDGR